MEDNSRRSKLLLNTEILLWVLTFLFSLVFGISNIFDFEHLRTIFMNLFAIFLLLTLIIKAMKLICVNIYIRSIIYFVLVIILSIYFWSPWQNML